MTYYVFTVTLKPAQSILPVPCDHPLSPLSVFVALICHLVLTHCILQHQRSGILCIPPFAHPRPWILPESVSKPICFILLLTSPVEANPTPLVRL